MKFSALRNKLKRDIFVRPLYTQNKKNRIKPTKSIIIDVQSKLHGRGFKNVKTKKSLRKESTKIRDFNDIISIDSSYDNPNPNLNSYETNENKKRKDSFVRFNHSRNMNSETTEDIDNVEEISHKNIQTHGNVHHQAPITYLRLYPAPALRDEGIGSQVLRCVVSQFGLIALLIIWTLIWWIVINYFEEPYEQQVTDDYEKEQNQLIIDLATELRQISQHSLKWRPIIEARVQQERILTLNAVGRGAKLNPGAYWDLSGTLLFTVFVMTAFGFGAPVPQTTWGRTSALVYATLAVPSHLYLMINLSTCIVFHMEMFISRCQRRSKRNNRPNSGNHHPDNNGIRNTNVYIKPFTAYFCRTKIKRLLSILCIGRGMPLAIIIYYAMGAIFFGYLRDQTTLNIIMFPCLFTTSGGLETIQPIVRVLYGLYVEGALLLVAIGIAILKFHNNDSMDYLAEKYRLYTHCNYV